MARPYAHTPAAPRSPPPPATTYGPWAIALPAVGVLVVAGMVFLFVVVPIVLRSRCISMAADRGVALTIDHVDIGVGDVELVRVGFALDGVPQLTAHADDAQVTLSGLTPSNATAIMTQSMTSGLDCNPNSSTYDNAKCATPSWASASAKPRRKTGS